MLRGRKYPSATHGTGDGVYLAHVAMPMNVNDFTELVGKLYSDLHGD